MPTPPAPRPPHRQATKSRIVGSPGHNAIGPRAPRDPLGEGGIGEWERGEARGRWLEGEGRGARVREEREGGARVKDCRASNA